MVSLKRDCKLGGADVRGTPNADNGCAQANKRNMKKKVRFYLLFLVGGLAFYLYLFFKTNNTPARPCFLVNENTVSKIEGYNNVSLHHTKNSSASMERQRENITATTENLTLPIMDFEDLKEKKVHILLLLIVRSGASKRNRRDAVRETWWKHCRGTQVMNHIKDHKLLMSPTKRSFTNYVT